MSIQNRIQARISQQSFMTVSLRTDVPGLPSLPGKLRVAFQFKHALIKFENGDVLTVSPVFYDVTPVGEHFRVQFCFADIRLNGSRYDELKLVERLRLVDAGNIVSMPLELYHDLDGEATMFGLEDQYIMKAVVDEALLMPYVRDVKKHTVPIDLTAAFSHFIRKAEKSAYRTTLAKREEYNDILEAKLNEYL